MKKDLILAMREPYLTHAGQAGEWDCLLSDRALSYG